MTSRARKPAQAVWEAMTEPMKMADGSLAVTWRHTGTEETKVVPLGMHPDETTGSPLSLVPQEDEPMEETAVDRIAAMLRVAGDSERADLKVYRIKEGTLQFCASYKPETFENGDFEMIRKRFGAGEYEIRLYATDPVSRRFGVRTRTKLAIAEDAEIEAEQPLGNGMAQVLGAIADGQRQMLDALVAMKQTPPKDPMEDMSKMLSMMSLMREAMGLNGGSQQKSSIGEIVDAIKELRAASEIIEDKQEEDSTMKMLPQVLELVKAGVISQPQQPQPMAAMIPPVQLPPDMAAHIQPQIQGTQAMPDHTSEAGAELRELLTRLCRMKDENKTVEEAAQFVYDYMPDEIVEIMFSSVWLMVLKAVANVDGYEDWLARVRPAAMALFETQEDDAQDDTQALDEQPKKA